MIYSAERYLSELPWVDQAEQPIVPSSRPGILDHATSLEHWRKQGFIIFRDVIDKEVIAAYREELEIVRRSPADFSIEAEVKNARANTRQLQPDDIERAGTKLHHMHVASGNAARLALNDAVTSFLGVIFESAAVPMQSLTFIRGSQQPTHIDYPYVNRQRRIPFMAASWIPLEEVSIDAGPVAYFPGAHKPEVVGFFDWGSGDIIARPETRVRSPMEFASYLDQKLAESGIAPTLLLPELGDVLIWHGNLPHQGTRIKDATLTRRSLVTHYTGLSDYPEKWISAGDDGKRVKDAGPNARLFDFPWSKPDEKLPSWNLHLTGPEELSE